MPNPSKFSQAFSDRLSTYLNIDLARVKKVPRETIASFRNVIKEYGDNVEKIVAKGNSYGILKLRKYRVILFYIQTKEEYEAYVASEISNKRILNYIQYLQKR